MSIQILHGDCRETLKGLAAGSVHTCVTSPPYWGLRDYGVAGQLGLEATPEEYVQKMVEVFREVKRVLRDDGTLWLNLGDSYAGNSSGGFRPGAGRADGKTDQRGQRNRNGNPCPGGLKTKDLVGIPWRVAFALQADGWYLRADIIWHKPNPMPESVTDRPTKAHEYIFLLTKSPTYYYDHEAIKEEASEVSAARRGRADLRQKEGWSEAYHGNPPKGLSKRSARDSFKREGSKREQVIPGQSVGTHRPDREESGYALDTRNKRSVWTVSTKPFGGTHFATFPPDLIEPCIKAGAPVGGTVLDPFGGAGTTGLVSDRLGRHAILCELNPEYVAIAEGRLNADSPLFADVETA